MRPLFVLFLLAAPLLAEDRRRRPLAARFPDGATAFVEARGLAPKLEAVWASPLGEQVRGHPGFQAFLNGPEGLKLRFGQAMLSGATGFDLPGLLRAIAGREVALAVYGSPQRAVFLARVDGATAERLVTGAEILSKQTREVVLPAADGKAALWRLGPAYVAAFEGLLLVSPDQLLATAVRDGGGAGLEAHAHMPAARRFAGGDADLFGYVDLEAYAALLKNARMPNNLGEALFLGALAHDVPGAKWGAFAVALAPRGDAWALSVRGFVPRPGEPIDAVATAFGGTLDPLPFALPGNTVGVVRFKRDLQSVWSNRDALIAERGIPKMIEFETNFGNLSGGISWVEELLPSLGHEFTLIGTRRTWPAGGPAPVVRFPQGALLVKVKDAEKLALRLRVAFNNAIGIINITQQQQMQMTGPLLNETKRYQGIAYQTASYVPAMDEEGRPRRELPVRFNFTPSLGVVDGHLVIASTEDALKEIIDARGQATPAPEGANAGVWLEPKTIRALLVENRESLVAQTILKEGVGRAEAEQQVDVLLELAGLVRSLSLTATESASTLGVRFETVVGPKEG